MSRSLSVRAVDGDSSGMPDGADYWLCQKLFEGVEQNISGGVFLRLVVRATNADQWRVGRELRMRLEERFVAEGIRTPLPLLAGTSATGVR